MNRAGRAFFRRLSPRAWRPSRSAAWLLAVTLVLVSWAGCHAGTALIVERELQEPQAILSLGSHEWERLPTTAALAARYPGSFVLLTQPRVPTEFNCHMCANRVAWLGDLGVPADRVVVLPTRVTNTLTEAAAAREYAEQHAIRRLLVVTSPYHLRRTAATFDAVFEGTGVALGVYPAFEHSPARPHVWWADGYDRAYVRYEWAALAWYAVRHRISPFVSEGR